MFCCPCCSPCCSMLFNNVVQYCWPWIGCNNIVQYCWQLWTMLTWSNNVGSKTLFNPIFINYWNNLIVFNRVLSLHGLFYLYKNCDITFLTICLSWHTLSTSPVGRKPEHPEKTHDFRQSVFGRALTDSFHMSPWRESDPCTISEVKGAACSHDYHTEDPS
jgi:hypothetical protein